MDHFCITDASWKWVNFAYIYIFWRNSWFLSEFCIHLFFRGILDFLQIDCLCFHFDLRCTHLASLVCSQKHGDVHCADVPGDVHCEDVPGLWPEWNKSNAWAEGIRQHFMCAASGRVYTALVLHVFPRNCITYTAVYLSCADHTSVMPPPSPPHSSPHQTVRPTCVMQVLGLEMSYIQRYNFCVDNSAGNMHTISSFVLSVNDFTL